MANNFGWVILIIVIVLVIWFISGQKEDLTHFHGLHSPTGKKSYQYLNGVQIGVREVCTRFASRKNNVRCNKYAMKVWDKAIQTRGGNSQDYNMGLVDGIKEGCSLFADEDKKGQCYSYLKEIEKSFSNRTCYSPRCKDISTDMCKPGYLLEGQCDVSRCNAYNDPNEKMGCQCCRSLK